MVVAKIESMSLHLKLALDELKQPHVIVFSQLLGVFVCGTEESHERAKLASSRPRIPL